jgi:putative tryptophan/tyrosine transport system substrate-binding protein
MRRREFIAGLGSTAAWPLAVGAQQQLAMPVIGFLASGSFETRRSTIAALNRGLSETGYVEGRNLTIEYRWAEDHYEWLPALAEDLVRRRVAVIVAFTTPAALAAKTATQSIPVVFSIGADPIRSGLVASLSRPGANLTGIYNFATEVAAKRLEMLHELVPAAKLIAYLVNPTNTIDAATETTELQAAARTLGVRLLVLKASDPNEFDASFATLVREGAGGIVIGSDAFFGAHIDQLVLLAARYAVPAMYPSRAWAASGGLMSYGTDFSDPWRQVGVYAGRILHGEKPANLPVQQVTKVLLVINMKVAKALGVTFPTALLVRADEVIE